MFLIKLVMEQRRGIGVDKSWFVNGYSILDRKKKKKINEMIDREDEE